MRPVTYEEKQRAKYVARQEAWEVLKKENLKHVVYGRRDDEGHLMFLTGSAAYKFESDERYYAFLESCNDLACEVFSVHAEYD